MSVAAIIRPYRSALRDIDLGLLYLLLWLSGTAFLSLAFFLAALSSSASMTTSLYSAQFLFALVTIAASSSPYDQYEYGYNSEGDRVCYLITSSFNAIYSTQLLGNTFVQFLVFFLPWFHAATSMSDILSVVQYEGTSVSMSDVGQTVDLVYSTYTGSRFTSPWIKTSLLILMGQSLV